MIKIERGSCYLLVGLFLSAHDSDDCKPHLLMCT